LKYATNHLHYGNQPEYSLHYLNTRNTGIENPRVLGSIPSPGTKFISTDLHGGPFFVSEHHDLSILPPNQFYRTQPNSPHINLIVWV
ncbi:hypothetical protein QTQ01_27005, partial [Escherichia coli]|uniref:hypothetical protein n=2 Tax=Escherichia coli TaxID=562 RepID=UPI0039C63520